MITKEKWEEADIGEMIGIAHISKDAGFNRVQIDPDHLMDICYMALQYLRDLPTRESAK